MRSPAKKWTSVAVLIVLGLAIGVGGIYVGETDDAPGAGVGGLLLMIGALVLAVRIIRRKPSPTSHT